MMRLLPVLLVLALGAGSCATPPAAVESRPPIIFVHGNGDTAALWITTIWRFESNGWDRPLLHAIDFRDPLARADDSRPQPHRSSSFEQREQLAVKVAE